MPWKKSVALLCLLVLLLFLYTCTLDLEVPKYSLDFKGEILYDPATANVIIYYTFVAEETTHPCTYNLCRVDGTPEGSIVIPSTTEILAAGLPQKFETNLSGYDDGVYRFRVVVQVERSPDDYVDLPFLDKTFEFYLDGDSPIAPTITLPTDTYVGDQVVLFDHLEWTTPVGSPVEVYYTLNGTEPDPPMVGQRFEGSPVFITASATPVTVKAVACDMVEDHVGPPAESIMSFMDALTVTPTSASRSSGDPIVGVHTLLIEGYGFSEENNEVQLYDVDGTQIPVVNVTEDDVAIGVSIDLRGMDVNPGVGQLSIINHDSTSLPTDYLDFTIE
jgi:hypothetical protein